ncbi:MAG: flavodoxin domain-containing protein [Chlorobium sp.]
MKAIILYDSRSAAGYTENVVGSIGLSLVESGFYVEKAKCTAVADYRFVKGFDLVVLGAPVYNFVVASQLLGAFIHGNLKKSLKSKKVALFLICGSSEPMAALLYLPQLKMHLMRNKILAEKIFAPDALSDGTVDSFVEEVLIQYHKEPKSRALSEKWTDEAQEWFQSMPSFMQGTFKTMAEEYAEKMGYKEITLEVLAEARDNLGGT